MVDVSQYVAKHRQLLRDLKNTTEGLLASQVSNVWSIYGGLNRIHSLIDKIFLHGCKLTSEEKRSSYLKFINGLGWLQPENLRSSFSLDCEYRPHIPVCIKEDKASIWLYRSLENHCLSQKLSWLLSDKNHLTSCYEPYAFLCQDEYAEAVLICLRGIERNQPSLIAEINPCLYIAHGSERFYAHRRSSSFPDHRIKKISDEAKIKLSRTMTANLSASSCKSLVEDGGLKGKLQKSAKLKAWNSTPNLEFSSKEISTRTLTHSSTMSCIYETNKEKGTTFKKLKNLIRKGEKKTSSKKKFADKKDVHHVMFDNRNIIEHTPSTSLSSGNVYQVGEDLAGNSFRSLPESKLGSTACSPKSVGDYSFLALPGEKDYRNYPKTSFIEDGGISILPGSTGYVPRPAKGQSLLSFLTSCNSSKSNAELDRENAHFNISEAIIAAMEQIRCENDMRLRDEEANDSDPEIIDLKQRIRLRRRAKMVEKQKRMWAASVLSDGKTETSISPYSTSPDTFSDSTDSDTGDLKINDSSNLADNRGLSTSMASLFSEADLQKSRGTPDGASDILSAEGVALCLIRKFSKKQMPSVSDLEWLVSEEDAPQRLLPLPKSWPIDPDNSEFQSTTLRGTKDWAPPRRQIIFTLHPSITRKKMMEKQNYRCAGCSVKVDPKYATKYRYCDYLGRYFCTSCHTNQLALIPARIIHKWDFTRYPVSNFSYRLLEQMYSDPLFRVFELNKYIGNLSRNLQICHRYKRGLYFIKDFIYSCRYAESIQSILNENSNLFEDPEMFSIKYLVSIKTGEVKNTLKDLAELCCNHIMECELCYAKGFICEICKKDEIIFPWQSRKVSRCDKCGCCYHLACWNEKESPCRKCTRIKDRKQSIT